VIQKHFVWLFTDEISWNTVIQTVESAVGTVFCVSETCCWRKCMITFLYNITQHIIIIIIIIIIKSRALEFQFGGGVGLTTFQFRITWLLDQDSSVLRTLAVLKLGFCRHRVKFSLSYKRSFVERETIYDILYSKITSAYGYGNG
jgi:hypothetical protein